MSHIGMIAPLHAVERPLWLRCTMAYSLGGLATSYLVGTALAFVGAAHPATEMIRLALLLVAFLPIAAIGGDAPSRVHGVVSGLGSEHETWIGVFSDPVAPGVEATSWIRAEGDRFEVEVPHSGAVTLVGVARNALPVLKRVSPGDRHTEVSMEFSPGAMLSGVAVSDADGTPLEDVVIRVTAVDGGGLELPEPVLPRWISDDEGRFHAGGLEPGRRYVVRAEADGYVPTESSDLQVDAGVDLEIRLVPGFHAGGWVVDRAGLPVAAAEVRVFGEANLLDSVRTDGVGWFHVGPFAAGRVVDVLARSDAGGTARPARVDGPRDDLVLVLHGAVTVTGSVHDADTGERVDGFSLTALHDGQTLRTYPVDGTSGGIGVRVDWQADEIAISAPGYSRWWRPVQFSDRDGGNADYDLGIVSLSREIAVAGRVVDEATGEPVAGAVVAVVEYGGAFRPRVPGDGPAARVRTATDEFGEFRFATGIRRGGLLRVAADGYAALAVQVAGDAGSLLIELGKGGTIAGVLKTARGMPVKGKVLLRPTGTSPAQWSFAADHSTDEYGRFEFDRLGPGGYMLWPGPEAGSAVARSIRILGNERLEITVVVDLENRLSGAISGLMDGETARFSVAGQDRTQRRLGGADGHGNGPYELHGLPDGPTRVTASTGRRQVTREVEVANGTARADFRSAVDRGSAAL
ncbi:MAG: carboxypeptidase-like regulatory domain-containing protein [Gammaproteobacteria bacterium]|nr:carboxypeptidase-like regulatory domain-containing protein [Gammaproteobacteria bacterium]